MTDDLHELLVSAGLGRVADVIIREARSSIFLTSSPVEDGDALPIGVSKLGGSPDLPLDFVWPDYQGFPLPFVAQINLWDIAAYDVQKGLPSVGMLYFFYDYDHHRTFMLQESPDMWRVRYFDGEMKSLRQMQMPPSLPKYRGPFKPCLFMPSSVITFAPYNAYSDGLSSAVEQFGPVAPFTSEEVEAYQHVLNQFGPPSEGRHRMLGHGDGVQCEMPFHGLVLLLQVDTDDNADIMWGDVGTIYYMITPEDLARRDFRNICFNEQCC
ncbi:MAG: YwqG family protein [Thermomicrobiales bacterium]